MKEKLVSSEEYKKALAIVNQYLDQMKEQYQVAIKDVLHIPTYTEDTKIVDCDISVRLINALNANWESFGLQKTDSLYRSDVTVGDLAKLSQKKLLASRNMGKKSLKEVIDLAYGAGIILKP